MDMEVMCFLLVVFMCVTFSDYSHCKFHTNASMNDTYDYCYAESRYVQFNYQTHVCCENTVIEKQISNWTCCDKHWTSESKSTCCREFDIDIIDIKKLHCCGSDIVIVGKEYCLNESVHLQIKDFPKIQIKQENSKPNTLEKPPLNVPFNRMFVISLISVSILVVLLVIGIVMFVTIRTRTVYSRTPSYKKNQLFVTDFRKGSHEAIHLVTRPKKQDVENAYTSTSNRTNLPMIRAIHISEPVTKRSRPLHSLDSTVGKQFVRTIKENTEYTSVDARVQTTEQKTINLKDAFGEDFTAQQVFDIRNRSMILVNPDVKLTLSEDDLIEGEIMCYASPLQNLCLVYKTLHKVLATDESIVSPTVQFYSPRKEPLSQFASVDLPFCHSGTNIKVWSVLPCLENRSIQNRYEIPWKDKHVNDLEEYYEIASPGQLQIYLKRFGLLFCTSNEEHKDYSLSAYMYIVPRPFTGLSKDIRVTLYVLDGVSLFYFNCRDDETDVEPVRKRINLPGRPLLDDVVNIRLTPHFDDNIWQRSDNGCEAENRKITSLQNIIESQRKDPNGASFSTDWFFSSRRVTELVDNIVFKCGIEIQVVQTNSNGSVSQEKNTFILSRMFDISDLKKTLRSNLAASDTINDSLRVT